MFDSVNQRASIADIPGISGFPVAGTSEDAGWRLQIIGMYPLGFIVGPTLASLSPNTVRETDGTTIITVTGTAFAAGAVLAFDLLGNLPTTFVNTTTLTATVTSAQLATIYGTGPVANAVVKNLDGGTSNTLTFTVTNPLPTLTSILPTSATVGSPNTTITLTGANLSIATAYFNGVALATNFVNITTLTAVIPSSDLLTATTASITLVVTTPGGGTSAPQTFTVGNPSPTLVTISPNAVPAGSPNTTLTVTGTNFINTSVINFGATPLTTTFVNGTTLTAVIPSTSLQAGGSFSITVVNPGPGGGTTAPIPFSVIQISAGNWQEPFRGTSLNSNLFKRAAEKRLYVMDFSLQSEISNGDTIASVVSVVETAGGANTSDLTITNTSISTGAKAVQCDIGGGVDGVMYKIEFTVNTVGGAVIVAIGYLSIIDT
jgi:hypothetical protein